MVYFYISPVACLERLSLLLAAAGGSCVEEVDCGEEDPVGNVRQEETERLLVGTAALTAGERGQQGPEVRGLTEDHPVHRDWDSLSAVEDQVSPPLLSHVPANTGHQDLSVAPPSL